MGLIKAIGGAIGGTLADQWKEYFYCEALPADVIVKKGSKKVSDRSSNYKGEDNIISNGSLIAVADGQCMIIVEQGKVVDLCAEPGEYKYDMSTEPSIFAGGGLLHNIGETFKTIGKRFTFGGDTAKDQRVYYFNTKELIGNKYGTPTPVPFRVVDERAGIDMDISMRCFGEYSYRVTNPLLFYTNVCGNVSSDYKRDNIDSQLKTELLTALQPAFARISEMGIRYSSLPGHTKEIANALNEELSSDWRDKRGIEIVSFGVSSISADPEQEKELREMQKTAAYFDPLKAATYKTITNADAMKIAAGNTAGASVGFMNVGMAQNSMGADNTAEIMRIQQEMAAKQASAPQATVPQTNANEWTCPNCGTKATGKFCPECGAKKHEDESWICPKCGAKVTGKFCSECGTKKPEVNAEWTCSCGTVNKGKFCSNCGNPKPTV